MATVVLCVLLAVLLLTNVMGIVYGVRLLRVVKATQHALGDEHITTRESADAQRLASLPQETFAEVQVWRVQGEVD